MSATTSSAPGAQTKAQQTQPARQGPRVSNGNTGAPKKAQNGSPKPDAGRKSPQPGANGQQAKSKTQAKPKASAPVSDYLRHRGATVEVANAVTQIRSDLGGYYSEELVYNTFVANGNNAEATRAALTRTLLFSPLASFPRRLRCYYEVWCRVFGSFNFANVFLRFTCFRALTDPMCFCQK